MINERASVCERRRLSLWVPSAAQDRAWSAISPGLIKDTGRSPAEEEVVLPTVPEATHWFIGVPRVPSRLEPFSFSRAVCGFPELSPEVCEFSKELASKARGVIAWKDGPPRQRSEYLCWQNESTKRQAKGAGVVGGGMSSEQKGVELCVLTVLPAPISVKDEHVPKHVSPLTSEQGAACGRAHECIPFEKYLIPMGLNFHLVKTDKDGPS